ncbi:WhiB family transcriptional regulator [Frankia sp. AgB1.9]|jgi:WhiB family redox-sensing transcriptional regulator|uniref:Transcriptional regulator WhiB n=1 Tax=Pseudofrankia inefficax (strain DSM 45817 / CECT 9037 / DDB 130130 / EuI1c) TaxID=298654 RepID=E3JAD2_PSEI1|nr:MULTISPECIES: WhiB family transcriptional regulator [Frankiaceae]ADP80983.1 transcription factor WhiB [Pseudofrankia inefficax]MBL7489572.1 WhiB family transcriptional regulator [Frankia sp. AgW1.1]MBL7552194.1 WhiB family transcriptional regulator [Frankia sp. AgB1.9]MBL7618483.1 WhiB family transcriptional regulator [Frankia sp. AgB1.8]
MSAGVPVLPGRDLEPQPFGPGWPAYWRQDAACRDGDPDAFFPPDGRNTKARAAAETRARKICSTCAVRRPCLATAIFRQEEHGVWGGLTSDQRANLIPRGRISAEDALLLADRLLPAAAVAAG